uniref:Uncharacterized protein n=1 Tax=Anguilla anguilla TaxID=7936 RepID=A0A0E9VLQ1_ANGAN
MFLSLMTFVLCQKCKCLNFFSARSQEDITTE